VTSLQGVRYIRRSWPRKCYPATFAGTIPKGRGLDPTPGCYAAHGAGFASRTGCRKPLHTKGDSPHRENLLVCHAARVAAFSGRVANWGRSL